jgi:hypothetical protein
VFKGLKEIHCVKTLLTTVCLSVILVSFTWGQAQPAATPEQLGYLRYVLTTLANPMFDQRFIKAQEEPLIIASWELNVQEAASFRAAVQSMSVVFQDVQQRRRAIVAGKTTLSPNDQAAIVALNGQLEGTVTTLANQILNSVRPEIAARLRRASEIVANATNKTGVN